MRITAKTGFWVVVVGLFVALAAFGLKGIPTAQADLLDGELVPTVWVVADYGIDAIESEDCADATLATVPRWNALNAGVLNDSTLVEGNVIKVQAGESILLCVNPDEDEGPVTFDSDEVGEWSDSACGDGEDNDDGDSISAEFPDDACIHVEGEDTDTYLVPDETASAGINDNDIDVIIIRYTCSDDFGVANVVIWQGEDDDELVDDSIVHFTIVCEESADTATVTASPTTVEIVPARGNTSHSLVTAVLSGGGGPIWPVGTEVQFMVDKCAIEESGVDTQEEFLIARDLVRALPRSGAGMPGVTSDPLGSLGAGFTGTWDAFADLALPDTSPLVDVFLADDNTSPTADIAGVLELDSDLDGVPDLSLAAAIFHAEVTGCTPGPATVTVIVEVPGGTDLVRTVQIQVVGPPAAVTVSAAPTSVRCGELVAITVTVKDAIGQNVSDHTLVEMVTNLGGVLGGTGAVAASAGPVVPISSTVAETFGGIANAFLLTSESHSGPYVVIATTGGTAPFDTIPTTLGGVFSTPPVSNNVSVSCTIPAAAAPTAAAPVTAPRTGQGSIVPPNTGDAGLLSESSSSTSWTLFALGSLGLALAGVAVRKLVKS